MGAKGKYVRTYQKGRGKLHQHLPDYLNDLNAMHEAEKVIRERADRVDSYLDQLDGAMSGVHATAAQRAEAFLRTLGLWKP